jgi:hypothetical protein
LLEPGLGYLLPANPAGGHSFHCGAHVFEYRDGLDRDLGRTSASSEPDSNLDIYNGKAPNVIKYCRADALLRGFFHTYHYVNHYGMGNPLVRGLGCVTEPSALASALSRNRANTKGNNKYKTIL